MKSALEPGAEETSDKINLINPIYTALIDWTQNVIRSTERTTIWICGIILAVNGWIVRFIEDINDFERLYFSMASTLFGLLGMFIVISLHRRFSDLIGGIRRVNFAQMTYEPSVFLKDAPLFPKHWDENDSKRLLRRVFSIQEEPIFMISYVAISITTIFAGVMIWLF